MSILRKLDLECTHKNKTQEQQEYEEKEKQQNKWTDTLQKHAFIMQLYLFIAIMIPLTLKKSYLFDYTLWFYENWNYFIWTDLC